VSISPAIVSEVNTDGARVAAAIDPNGGVTDYFVEYGQQDCDLGTCSRAPAPTATLSNTTGAQQVTVVIAGLEPDTAYHYRVVAANSVGEVKGAEDVFRTFARDSTEDPCPNALIRKETLGVLLPDCRAYELVSPANAGGYDLRSDLIPGQAPLRAKPRAADTVLYSMSFGKVPGVEGEPTNHSLDPYLASRTAGGWTTHYAGIAVGDPPAQGPFASTPLEESEDLSTLVFGGEDLCHPCFEDGKTGLPLRRDGGPLTQGMAGDLDPGPTATPDGYVARPLSADGTHLVFGSAADFEPDASSTGDISIYVRDLATGVTRVASKAAGGGTLPCLQGPGSCQAPGDADGIGSLDVSDDGTRVIVAQRVSTDPAGNRLWHPYMYLESLGHTVDLAPGTTAGVAYDGMTADGSSVFFTTADALTADDQDASADLYRADVAADGAVALERVSSGSGGAGNGDTCNPAAAGARSNWNAVGAVSPDDCGVVGFSGGAGVARGSGTAFFISPETLDGSGSANQPNLFVVQPGGAPHRVATLEPTNQAIADAVMNHEAGGFGDIQVTPDGNYAAFSSFAPLTGFPTFGHEAIYRYSVATESVSCGSCPTTRATLTTDTGLSPYGLNLADDGRLFFTSLEPLALRDTGSTADVYESSGERISLITTGRSATDSRLLTVSGDGLNAFFFTRDLLVPGDHNGRTVKIYTAREHGGFPIPVVRQACQASDECHGPSSAAPPAATLPTVQGTGGNFAQAAKKKRHKARHRRHRHHRHHGHHRRHKGHHHRHAGGRG
jgi:hypothetical protein